MILYPADDAGKIKVDQMRRQYDFEIKGAKIFATCNEAIERRLHLPKYSRDQFLRIAVKVCPRLSEEIALIIAEETWEQQGDIRDVISLS